MFTFDQYLYDFKLFDLFLDLFLHQHLTIIYFISTTSLKGSFFGEHIISTQKFIFGPFSVPIQCIPFVVLLSLILYLLLIIQSHVQLTIVYCYQGVTLIRYHFMSSYYF